MNTRDQDAEPVDALSNAAREMQPSAGFTDRTIDALRQRDLVRAEPARFRRPLIAAAWFIAGLGTGAAAMALWRAASEQTTPVIASNDFVEWY